MKIIGIAILITCFATITLFVKQVLTWPDVFILWVSAITLTSAIVVGICLALHGDISEIIEWFE